MSASIIIITKNQKGFLEKSLPTIFNQDYKDFEVVAVDSGSTDGALELMKGFKLKIIKISSDTFNYADAFNQGARNTEGEILVRLSGDVIPGTKGWLSSIIANFKDIKVGAVFGGFRTYPDDSFLDRIFSIEVLATKFILGSKRKVYKKGLVVVGANMALRRKLWQRFSFDDSLPRADDNLFVGQIHKAGWLAVYEPQAWAFHNHGLTRPWVKEIRENIKAFYLIKKKL